MESLTFRRSPLSSGLPLLGSRPLVLWLRKGGAQKARKCDLLGALDLASWVEAFGGSELRWGAARGCQRTLRGCIDLQTGGEGTLAGTCPAASRARMRRFLSRKGRFSLRQSKSGTRSASKDFCKSLNHSVCFICWRWDEEESVKGAEMVHPVLRLERMGQVLTGGEKRLQSPALSVISQSILDQ